MMEGETNVEILYNDQHSPRSDTDSSSSASSLGDETVENQANGTNSMDLVDLEERDNFDCSPSPPSPRQEDLSEQCMIVEQQRVSCSNSKITAALARSSQELWSQFDAIGTEMIVTRRGRRMFPPIKVELYDLNPNSYYVLLMDMAPVDKYRYKYQTNSWVRCFEEECSPSRLYTHPDSPALGSHWMNSVINFYKLKLTNNQLDKQGHIIVNSMHKYQPRLHVVETSDPYNLNWEQFNTFIFPGTQFTTVTAYQNDKITQLKIENNPFAKGFRSPFSRCRARNHHRITICSTGSESSEDSTAYPPRFVMRPPSDHRQEPQLVTIVGQKRKSEGGDDDSSYPVKHICLTSAMPEQRTVKVSAPNLFMSPSTTAAVTSPPMVTAVTSQGQTVAQPQSPLLIYMPVVQTPEQNQQQKTVNGLNRQMVIQTSGGQILNGTTLLQADPTAVGQSLHMSQAILKPQVISSRPKDVVQVGRNFGQTLIQSNGQPATLIAPPQSLIGSPYTSAPPQLITSTVSTIPKIKTVSSACEQDLKITHLPPTSVSKLSSPTCIDISALTDSKRSFSVRTPPSPPPLVQIKPEIKVEKRRSPPPPASTPSSVTVFPRQKISSSSGSPSMPKQLLVQAPYTTALQQQPKVLIVADKNSSANTVLVPIQSSVGASDVNSLQTQTLFPIAYDQQVVAPVPIYRFNSLNTAVQPIQILATVPDAAQNKLTTV